MARSPRGGGGPGFEESIAREYSPLGKVAYQGVPAGKLRHPGGSPDVVVVEEGRYVDRVHLSSHRRYLRGGLSIAPDALDSLSVVDVFGDTFQLRIPKDSEFHRPGIGNKFDGFIDLVRQWYFPWQEEVLRDGLILVVIGGSGVVDVHQDPLSLLPAPVVSDREKGWQSDVVVSRCRSQQKGSAVITMGPIVALSVKSICLVVCPDRCCFYPQSSFEVASPISLHLGYVIGFERRSFLARIRRIRLIPFLELGIGNRLLFSVWIRTVFPGILPTPRRSPIHW